MNDAAASVKEMMFALDQLRQALDRHDAVLIAQATKRLGAAVDDIRSQNAETLNSEQRGQLEAVMSMIDAARRRINMAADDVRRRIDTLAEQGADVVAPVYGR